MLRTKPVGTSMALGLGILFLVGCADTAGIDTGSVQITLQRSTATSAPASGAAAGAIDLANVASLMVEITSVRFLPVVAEGQDPQTQEDDEAAWVEVDLTNQEGEGITIDLTSLPTSDESPLVIAEGTVDAGDYRKVRLIVGEAWVEFVSGFTVGNYEYAATPEQHPVTVPSGAQTGLKTDASFTVEGAGGTTQSVSLFFDDGTSIRNATATGSGSVNVNPVLRSSP